MEEAGADSVRWRLACPDRIRVVRLTDDATVVFNPLSWQTHYLNEAAQCVFDALTAGPLTVGELIAETVDAHDQLSAKETDEWTRTLLTHLGDLVTMGLVTREAVVMA
jgi:PqqD family protein of HPr-rel-A system